MKAQEMVAGLYEFIQGHVAFDKVGQRKMVNESPKIVPAEPPAPKKPTPPPPPPKANEDKAADKPVCKACKSEAVQMKKNEAGQDVWMCTACGKEIMDGKEADKPAAVAKTEPPVAAIEPEKPAKEGKETPSKENDVSKLSPEALIKALYEEMLNDKSFAAEMAAINEVAPEGWEGSVKKMKKSSKIDNPWALAWYMKKKGYKPAKEGKETPSKENDVSKLSPEALIKALYEDTKGEYSVIAAGISDQATAQDLATRHKGHVVADPEMKGKFLVIAHSAIEGKVPEPDDSTEVKIDKMLEKEPVPEGKETPSKENDVSKLSPEALIKALYEMAEKKIIVEHLAAGTPTEKQKAFMAKFEGEFKALSNENVKVVEEKVKEILAGAKK